MVRSQLLEKVDKLAKADQTVDSKHLSHESLNLLLMLSRLNQVEGSGKAALRELKDKQQKVAFLHQLMKKINAMTTPKNEFDWTATPELKELFLKAKEMGVELDENVTKYSADQRERLMENFRMTVEDLNTIVEFQLKTVTHLHEEKHQSFQMANSIIKPLDAAKKKHANYISPR